MKYLVLLAAKPFDADYGGLPTTRDWNNENICTHVDLFVVQ